MIWQDWFNYNNSVIYSYRVERAINLSSTFDMKNDIIIHRKMISAIHIHRKSMESVFMLWYMYVTNESFLTASKVITLLRQCSEIIDFSKTYYNENKVSNKNRTMMIFDYEWNRVKVWSDCYRKYPKMMYKNVLYIQAQLKFNRIFSCY